jgi:hypothetical protein
VILACILRRPVVCIFLYIFRIILRARPIVTPMMRNLVLEILGLKVRSHTLCVASLMLCCASGASKFVLRCSSDQFYMNMHS